MLIRLNVLALLVIEFFLENQIIYQSTLKILMYWGHGPCWHQLQINWIISFQLIIENDSHAMF
jgi:hypothetical protein